VALHSLGNASQAIMVLENAHQQRPADREVLSALVTYLREGGDNKAALRYAEQLLTLTPGDHEVQRLVETLYRQAGSQ
jgi:Flp pilus assembly protein TadD